MRNDLGEIIRQQRVMMSLTLAELADRIVDQFDLVALRHRADADKLAGLRDYLRSHPCLVVVDNLETAAMTLPGSPSTTIAAGCCRRCCW